MADTVFSQRRLNKLRLGLRLFPPLFALFILLVWVDTIRALPVSDYRKNIETSIQVLDALTVADEHESLTQYQARFTVTLNSVRAVLPVKQDVEWGGTTFNVDNSWLHQRLEESEKATETDRRKLLARILERLSALNERVLEIEKGSVAGIDGGQAKRKLEEILARAAYARKVEQGSALSRLLSRFFRWLSSLFGSPKPVQPGSAHLITRFSQIFVVVFSFGVLAYVLLMFRRKIRRTRGTRKEGKPQPRVVLGERLNPEQSAVDLLNEAETLARRGEIRAAIRKAYVALLVELGDRKIISMAQHKTNRDYLRVLQERELLHGRMTKLTESFERHWYGFAQATDNDWAEFRAGYRDALQR